jgi:hypothetical protein
LIGEEQPERAWNDRRLQGKPRRAVQLFGQRTPDRVGDVDLVSLQRRQASSLVGDHAEAQRLDARRLAPVVLVGLEYQLDAGRERREEEVVLPRLRRDRVVRAMRALGITVTAAQRQTLCLAAGRGEVRRVIW